MRLALAALALSAGAAAAETPLVSIVAGDFALHAGAGDVANAEPIFDGVGNPALRVRLAAKLDDDLARLTAANLGMKLQILICGVLKSEPYVMEELPVAEFIVSGLAQNEATELAALMRQGSCDPAP